jgi:hypothetical protein
MTVKIITFQLKLQDTLNREVLSAAAIQGVNKHEWLERAVNEQLKRDKAVS